MSVRRTVVRRAVAGMSALGMTLGLVAAVAPAASAVEPGPLVMAIDADTRALVVGPGTGSATALPSLLPAGVDPRSFAVSNDAGVIAVGTRSGPHRSLGFPYAAFGLWVRTPDRTRIVSSSWDTTPAVTPDGSSVVWTATNSSGGRILRYDTATDSTSVACGDCIPATVSGSPASVYELKAVKVGAALRVALSMVAFDGNGQLRATQVRVVDLTPSSRTTLVDTTVTYANAATRFDGAELAFSTDGTTLVDVKAVRATSDDFLFDDQTSALGTFDLTQPTPTWTDRGLVGFYNPRQLGGNWYLFSDDAAHTVSTMSTSPDLATFSASTQRLDGAHTFGYEPVSAAPTAVVAPSPQLTTERFLDPTARSVIAGRRLGFDAYAFYQPSGSVTGLTNAQIGSLLGSVLIDGVLQGSVDGRRWTALRTTEGVVDGFPYDVTLVPSRTMRYRWVFAGSANVAAATSPVRVVTVVATVTAGARTKAGRTTVAGKASRSSGTVLLQRKAGSRWVKVAAARITSKRTYSFGARALVRGSYRVVTVGDGIQVSGVSRTVRV